MQVEEVRGHRALHQVLQVPARGVPVLEARQHVDQPGPAPAGAPAAVGEALLDRHARRVRKLTVARHIEGVAGMQRVEVAHVAMPRLGLQVRSVPLLDAAVLHQDQARSQLGALLPHLGEEGVLLATQDPSSLEHMVEQLGHELLVHRGPHGGRRLGAVGQPGGVLRAGRGPADPSAPLHLDQEVELEAGAARQQGPGHLGQEALVPREAPVLHQVRREPGAPLMPEAPERLYRARPRRRPQVGRMGRDPAAHAEGLAGADGPALREAPEEVEQRQVALRQAGHLRRPVVHLQVDVEVVVRVPRRREVVVPQALQVCGVRPGPRAPHQEVAAELEDESLQGWVALASADARQALVRG